MGINFIATIISTCPNNLSQQEQDEFWMNYALLLAKKAEEQGEVPVGAVIVQGFKKISEGFNLAIKSHDPTAHAEMIALKQAGKQLKNYRLVDLTLYSTLEPCPMCASAMVHARIKRVVYGAKDLKTGAIDTVFNLTSSDKLNHKISSTSGVLENACSIQISTFFKKRRAENKNKETFV